MTRIYLTIDKPDGHSSSIEITDDAVTDPMLEAADDLLETLTTGKRLPPKGLYELCAQAFATSRDEAKERILAATYNMPAEKISKRIESRAQIIARVATARRESHEARSAVVSWMEENGHGSDLRDHHKAEKAPGWNRYVQAEITYGYAIRAFEAWIDQKEGLSELRSATKRFDWSWPPPSVAPKKTP